MPIESFRYEGNCLASQGLPNNYSTDGIFNSHRKTIMESFSCAHFLRKLYLNFHMHCHINTTLKYLHFRSRHEWFGFYLQRWRRNVWWKMTAKSDVMTSKMTCDVKRTPWRHAWESSYTPPSCKTTFPSPGRVYGNSCRVCKNVRIFNDCEVLIWNSVIQVTVRHHEACQMMPNSYPNDRIFNLHGEP